MDIALDTFKKPAPGMPSENIGRSTITIDETGYLSLERLEQKLLDSGQAELLVDTDEKTLQLHAPVDQEDLRDTRIRLFLDNDTRAGLFHLVAQHARDESIIYTEPTLVRLVAV